ncbi:MAG: NAD(+)--rifampin ADP-ribosyltransferase [Chryseobacterium sp.]|nr:NAD(+)--rifampin ADP-ribosyltransferase [Chryseobacterium sp.]MBO9691277.1 NAD(+)--rifampin ADP-ribosyltransferase [Chryseobacterium sp.]
MEFSPFNPVIKLCLQGMSFEEKEIPEEAGRLFLQAWEEASDDHEKFLAAHYIARHQKTVADQLQWLETALEFALKINDDTVKSALPALYMKISKCYEGLEESEKSKQNAEQSLLLKNHPSDKGPFYHGTKADLQTGDLLTAGGNSNYQSDLTMNHIYFTALVNGAGLAAALAKGEGAERVYMVEPTGSFENDPNVTDKKFPGNPTRSYRSEMPLKIIGEVKEWTKPNPEDLQRFREKLEDSKGEIIN